jgi:hypothetical protein
MRNMYFVNETTEDVVKVINDCVNYCRIDMRLIDDEIVQKLFDCLESKFKIVLME